MNIEEAIKQTETMSQAAELLNMPFMTFKRKATKLGLYEPNQGARGVSKPKTKGKYPLDDILAGKYPKYQSNKLRNRLIVEGYKEAKCESCGNDQWMGQQISLEVDHINGISNDHRLENLRILCPNCHAQTDTYRGKNIKPA